jgi:Glycosyltransferase 61
LVDVSVVTHMPSDFWDQVRLFASADIMIAPNGGWAPNVIWMPHESCLVELHQYTLDSWIQMFGLHRRFRDGNFVTLVGDYHDPNQPKRKRGFTRRGGDDSFMGSRLVDDLQTLARQDSSCFGRYMRNT